MTSLDQDVLAPHDLLAYRSEGVLLVPGLLEALEIEALRQEMARLHGEGRLVDLLGSGSAAEPGGGAGAGAGAGTAGGQRAVNLQLCPLGPHSALVTALRRHPRMLAVVRALVGDPLLFLLDQVFIKPGRCGAGTDWHQDHAYFGGGDPLLGVGVWLPLQDATSENGTMQVVPGSQRQAVVHRCDPRSQALIRAEVDRRQARTVEMRAGDALFFGFGVLHATQDNRSPHPRAAVALHFCQARYAPPAQWRQVEPLSGAASAGSSASWSRALQQAAGGA